MPIASPVTIRPISKQEFAKLDYEVMPHAFASQNELGRLCDEVIYQNDLAARLEAAGLGPVRVEVPVVVHHLDFAKTFSLDLVVADVAIYELKTAANLVSEHDAQLLNYLFLRSALHGKLVNFRPAQVESRFVNATVRPEERYRFDIVTTRWRGADSESEALQLRFVALLRDWGGYLELPLYVEALTHFLGGEQNVVRLVSLTRADTKLGNQKFHLLTPDTAFRVTALADGAEHYERHLQALLNHSPLRTIQWVNLARHRVEFVTLLK
jgi:GxxExxY protein